MCVLFPDTTQQIAIYDGLGRCVAEVDQAAVANEINVVIRYDYDEVSVVGCSGLERLAFSRGQTIESLAITATKSFRGIEPIKLLDGLKYLAIGGNVRFDINLIGRCRGLRRLWLNSVGEIPSLQFLSGSSQLEFLQMLFSTNVEDGDLGVLAELPRLRSVMYKYQAHYSHRLFEVVKLLKGKSAANQALSRRKAQ